MRGKLPFIYIQLSYKKRSRKTQYRKKFDSRLLFIIPSYSIFLHGLLMQVFFLFSRSISFDLNMESLSLMFFFYSGTYNKRPHFIHIFYFFIFFFCTVFPLSFMCVIKVDCLQQQRQHLSKLLTSLVLSLPVQKNDAINK